MFFLIINVCKIELSNYGWLFNKFLSFTGCNTSTMFKISRCRISSHLLNQRNSLKLRSLLVLSTKEVLIQQKVILIEISIESLWMIRFLQKQYGRLDYTNIFLILKLEERSPLAWIQISGSTGWLKDFHDCRLRFSCRDDINAYLTSLLRRII